MLASCTLLGQFLFANAGMLLYKITGGQINTSSSKQISMEDIQTQWTLWAWVFPWKRTAYFTGISVYKVVPTEDGDDVGVKIVGQKDYWDSMNIQPNSDGRYQTVTKVLR